MTGIRLIGTRTLSDHDYSRLLGFRDGLRSYLHWSEQQAAVVGLTTAQHQLLLAIRGHAGHGAPSVGDVAARAIWVTPA